MMNSLRSVLSVLMLRQPSFWERSWKHRLARLTIYAAVAYLAIIVALLLLEDRLLYVPGGADLSKPPAGVAVENIDMTSSRGDRIHAWWAVPKDWQPEQGAVLFCHGNGGNLSHRGRALPRWTEEMGQAVLLFDYPGYGLSSGDPSEQARSAKSAGGTPAALWRLARRRHGGRVGSAPAASRPCAGRQFYLVSRHGANALSLAARSLARPQSIR
jgi:pimeloyl-ACP methyl ester carboxylesterase